jgi:SAM-dependent methyltransferase
MSSAELVAMMSKHGDFLMGKPAVVRLQRAESGALARALAGHSGAHGLYLSMYGRRPGGWPRLGCLTRLGLAADLWHGDVEARADESLPFVDEAFRMVVLEHVLEWTPYAAELLDEAARVLEGDGYLAVAGFHPFSSWVPWLLCRRRPRPMLIAPGWVRQRLAIHDIDTLEVLRCGTLMPTFGRRARKSRWGGGFVLVARKRRTSVMTLRPARRVRQKAAPQPAWVPGTHRECA